MLDADGACQALRPRVIMPQSFVYDLIRMSANFDFTDHLHNQLTDRQRKKLANSNVERIWSAREIKNAFIESFELIGGVPRLALWANEPENYPLFMKMLLTLAPKETGNAVQGQILEYRSNVPHSPLNERFKQEQELLEVDDGDFDSQDRAVIQGSFDAE